MIESVSKTGGHLASGLGVIEMTIALHYVYNTPEDRIVWDVGHQSYPHKILTGRRAAMDTLRTRGGLAGFPKRSESPTIPLAQVTQALQSVPRWEWHWRPGMQGASARRWR